MALKEIIIVVIGSVIGLMIYLYCTQNFIDFCRNKDEDDTYKP